MGIYCVMLRASVSDHARIIVGSRFFFLLFIHRFKEATLSNGTLLSPENNMEKIFQPPFFALVVRLKHVEKIQPNYVEPRRTKF